MTELTASIAHEINQPLAAIVANASACVRFLARRPAAVPDAREAADCIVSDGTRAGEVISRIRALLSKQGPRHVVVDINGVIGDVIHLLRATLDRQRVVIHTELAASQPLVMGDAVQLQQVLVNLVINGLESLREGGRLRVTTSYAPETRTVMIVVEDTGHGMSEETLSRIFDLFFTTKPQGTGLGMALARSVIDLHGGDLTVHSALGKGTRVTIRLPLEPMERAGA